MLHFQNITFIRYSVSKSLLPFSDCLWLNLTDFWMFVYEHMYICHNEKYCRMLYVRVAIVTDHHWCQVTCIHYIIILDIWLPIIILSNPIIFYTKGAFTNTNKTNLKPGSFIWFPSSHYTRTVAFPGNCKSADLYI
jgi:hypothetical protein